MPLAENLFLQLDGSVLQQIRAKQKREFEVQAKENIRKDQETQKRGRESFSWLNSIASVGRISAHHF